MFFSFDSPSVMFTDANVVSCISDMSARCHLQSVVQCSDLRELQTCQRVSVELSRPTMLLLKRGRVQSQNFSIKKLCG